MPAAPPPDGPDPDLVDAVTQLPAKQRQAVAYHFLAGLPHAEVAVILSGNGKDASTVPVTGGPVRALLFSR